MFISLSRARFPFDCLNPIGYTIAYVLQCVFSWFCCFVISSCIACFGIVAFLLGLAVTKDLIKILYASQKAIRTKRNRLKGVKKFYRFIEFHSTAKQLRLPNSFGQWSQTTFNVLFIPGLFLFSWMCFNS